MIYLCGCFYYGFEFECVEISLKRKVILIDWIVWLKDGDFMKVGVLFV